LLRDFRFSGSPFPTSFVSLSLGPFSPAEANKLIETYTQDMGARFSKREMESIYEVSQGRPYQLQRECHKLFEQKTRRRWFQIPIRELITHKLSKAFINIGLVLSTISLVLVSAVWYKYVYPEIVVGTQITADGIGHSVRYPEWIGVGDTERFRITLANEGAHSLNNVRVRLEFSDAATIAPIPGRSLTAYIGSLPVKNVSATEIEFCPEEVSSTDTVQTDLFIASDELGEKLLNTYTFKVIDIPYIENFRGPKALILWFLKGVGALTGAFLMALVVSWTARIASS
jgi:hypothetical protein